MLPLVYQQLRRVAAEKMTQESAGHTLQATALVHEAWLRVGGEAQSWESRWHFFRAAAEAVSVKPHPGDAYFILLEGLHQYRAGKYKKAVALLLPINQGDRFPAWSAAASAIISMAYHQDGKVLKAKAEILRCQKSPYPHWPQRPMKGRWHDWLIAHLLLQEAEQLIGASSGTSQ